MFEKLFHFAEVGATTASRREFFGWLGRGALVSAATVGTFLAMTKEAEAGRGRRCPEGYRLCKYRDPYDGTITECIPNDHPCPRGRKR